MSVPIQAQQSSRVRALRLIVLLLAVLTSPLACCGAVQLIDTLPGSLLPGPLDFVVNLFESHARVENNTSEIFYLTAITTTYGHPMVIAQNIGFRQRDVRLGPGSAITLTNDSADLPLVGIAVCRSEQDCRLLVGNYASEVYSLNSYENLPSLDPSWREAIQAYPLHTYSAVIVPLLSVLPIALLAAWIYIGKVEKKRAAQQSVLDDHQDFAPDL